MATKAKTIRFDLEHPIQGRILELADSGKPVKLKDGRYVIGTDFIRELLILGYQQVDDCEFKIEVAQQHVVTKKVEKKQKENLDSLTSPI